jgi:hypothetical protein
MSSTIIPYGDGPLSSAATLAGPPAPVDRFLAGAVVALWIIPLRGVRVGR